MNDRTTTRTATRQVSKLQPGDRLLLMGLRTAVVESTAPLHSEGPLRFIDRGNSAPPEPVYWVQVRVRWEGVNRSPQSVVLLEGDRFVSLRSTN